MSAVQRPLADVVTALNAVDPAILTAYPSALELITEEQTAGRLHVMPVIVEAGGESMKPGARARLAETVGCALYEVYGYSEFAPFASDCPHEWLHVNCDWATANRQGFPADTPRTALAHRASDEPRQPDPAHHPLRLGRFGACPARSLPVRQPASRHSGHWSM